jgi:hypothetical protein
MSTNSHPQQHQMHLEKTHPSGAEEWYCPACGRRFLMQWPPKYKKIVMAAGDEYAIHSGGKGGLQISSVQMSQEQEDEPIVSDELRAAIEEALAEIDFDDDEDLSA